MSRTEVNVHNPKADCANHRMVIVSTEYIWANEYAERYGHPPIACDVTYRCKTCKHSHTVRFKETIVEHQTQEA